MVEDHSYRKISFLFEFVNMLCSVFRIKNISPKEESSWCVNLIAHDFRNIQVDPTNRELFKDWYDFVEEKGTKNTRAAILSYLTQHIDANAFQVIISEEEQTLMSSINENLRVSLYSLREETQKWKNLFLTCLIVLIPLIVIALWNPSRFLVAQLFFASFVQLYGGYPFHRAAFHVVKRSMRANMSVLITVSTFVAYGYSLWICVRYWLNSTKDDSSVMPVFETSATLIVIVLLGKWIEAFLKLQASLSLEELGTLFPTKVRLLLYPESYVQSEGSVNMEGHILNVDARMIEHDDIIQVEPDDIIPIDGIVVNGNSCIDESLLTGESLRVIKGVNDIVYAGSVNSSHRIIVKSQTVGGSTVLEGILKLWRETHLSQAPVEEIADKISSIFVPTVILLSCGVFMGWWLGIQWNIVPLDWWQGEGKVSFCLYFCLSAMVIACPCALGFATPIALMMASFVALKHGIIYRNISKLLEYANGVKHIVFDKTGTLTLGKPVVTNAYPLINHAIFPMEDDDADQLWLWHIVEQVEMQCQHPMAKALLAYINKFHLTKPPAENIPVELSAIENSVGWGVQCRFQVPLQKQANDHVIMIGEKDWVLSLCLKNNSMEESIPFRQAMNAIQALHGHAEEHSILLIAIDYCPVWMIFVQDAIRPEAYSVISFLKDKLHLQCWLVSGDNQPSVKRVARLVGIQESNVIAKALPWQKWNWLQTKMNPTSSQIYESSRFGSKFVCLVNSFFCTPKRTREYFIFVGDGLNDAPALAQADIGVAMGASSYISSATAAIILRRNDLRDLIVALDLSKKLKRVIYWNYGWALLYNLLAFPLAAGLLYPEWRIRIPPFLAAGSMCLSSISVILSSLRLKWYCTPFHMHDEMEKEQVSEEMQLIIDDNRTNLLSI